MANKEKPLEKGKAGKAPGPKGGIPDDLMTRVWLENAWGSWMKPVIGLVLIAIVAGLYGLGLLKEQGLGLVVGAAAALVPLVLGVMQAFPLMKSSRHVAMLSVAGLAAAAVAVLLVVGGTYPGKQVYEGVVSTDQRDVTLPAAAATKHLDMVVSGHIKGLGTSHFDIAVGTPKGEKHVEGVIKRIKTSGRIGRKRVRGMISEASQERFLLDLDAPAAKLHLETLDTPLDRVVVRLRKIWLPLKPLAGVALILVLLAVYLDSQAWGRTRQAHLTPAFGVSLLFAGLYCWDATPTEIVSNAIGDLMIAGVAGAVGGFVLSAIGRRILGTGSSTSTVTA